jgi:small-conductance mechanosensitive channel
MVMSTDELHEARREARVDAIAFVLAASALLVALAATSLLAEWELLGVHGWVWLALCVPEALLVVVLSMSARVGDHERAHRLTQVFLAFVVLGNLAGLLLLVAALLTEKSSDLSGAQLLTSGAVVWLTNVIVFGLWFWTLDGGGAVRRASLGRAAPDFLFPQDQGQSPAGAGWYPRLEDYVYVALTNGIAFSPTDTMPLTRAAKALMALESMISVVALLLVAARAVNVLGT